jgi:Tol biopolymer transport system component
MSSHRQSQPQWAEAQAQRRAEATMARNDAPVGECAILSASMTPPPENAPDEPRLDSWKEIASYLGRGIRTVQRWEREEGLPVHRLDHAKRGSVYASRRELTAWWESRRRPDSVAAAPSAAGSAAPREPRSERVTATSAATFWPALSSDARMVVYVSDTGRDGESPQVWLQQVGGSAIQLTSGQRDCAEPTFSADDTRVLFTATAESTRTIYEIPTLGGQPHLVRRAARNARYSPDGQWLAYIALEPVDTLRLVSARGGEERSIAPDLVDIASATWSDDSQDLLVVAHQDPSIDLDCWMVPVDGGTPVDTGVLRRGRQQGLIVITMPPACGSGSVFYVAGGRQGVHIWRQRIAPATFEATDAPELVTPGGDYAFFPALARGRLSFVGTHADTGLWSIAIDAASGKAHGPLRRLTRGAGIASHLTLSRDGNTLAYFAVSMMGGELHNRNLEDGIDALIDGEPGVNRGFPAISPSGQQVAYSAVIPGPPVRRPVFLTNIHGGETRLVRDDCGGRPRQWLDEQTLLVETFGSGLNSFLVLDMRDGAQRPLLAAETRRVSNPRVSPDGRWLAFDATQPGGSPEVAIAPLAQTATVQEADWIAISGSASHPFWSRDGRLLYYLTTFPNVDIRSRVLARSFDPSTGRVTSEATEVLTLREMIVPAMVTGATPIVAPDQIIFVLGDFRGDVWIRDV